MTTLYIIRHAYAGQHGDPRWPDDSLRPLTGKGQKQFRRVVKKLARRGFAPQVVATSPMVRCRQTADVVCERLSPPPSLVPLDALEPGSRLEELVEWSNAQNVETLAWVGHAPDVDRLAASLLGMRDGGMAFAKGAVAAIRFDDQVAPGEGELVWFANPKILKC
ncbi:MAG: histidine phosphatase family protein [Pirellulales bacterium]